MTTAPVITAPFPGMNEPWAPGKIEEFNAALAPYETDDAADAARTTKYAVKLRRLIKDLVRLEKLHENTYHDLAFTLDQQEFKREDLAWRIAEHEAKLSQHISRILTVQPKSKPESVERPRLVKRAVPPEL